MYIKSISDGSLSSSSQSIDSEEDEKTTEITSVALSSISGEGSIETLEEKPVPTKLQKMVRSISIASFTNRSSDLTPDTPPRNAITPRLMRTHSERNRPHIGREGQNTAIWKRKRSRSTPNSPVSATCPSLDIDSWKRQTKQNLERFANKRMAAGKTDVLRTVKKFIKCCGVGTTTIHQRIQEVLKTPGYAFLEPFLKIQNPTEFLTQKKKLKKRERQILIQAMGGKNVLICLQNLASKKGRAQWISFVERAELLKSATPNIHLRKMYFPPDFDRKYPIACIKKAEDLIDSFRFYYASNYKEDEPSFILNHQGLVFPDLGTSKGNIRKILFFTWLIQELNKALGVEVRSTSEQQARLICEGPDLEVQNQLIDKFKEITANQGLDTESVPRILDALEADLYPLFITKWVAENLKILIEVNEDINPTKIVLSFLEDRWLQLCLEHVPCFRLLQALSIGAYSHTSFILRQKFCPKLFDATVRMKSFAEDGTRYMISIHSGNKRFTVTHIKPYRFISGRTFDHEYYGAVNVHWTVRGQQTSSKFAANIWCEDLVLDNNKPFEQRFQIAERLGLFETGVNLKTKHF